MQAKKRDLALLEARAWLVYRICECGEWANDHSDASGVKRFFPGWIPSLPGAPTVRCRRFRPVRFIVKRAP